jgi:HprK-related kinase B
MGTAVLAASVVHLRFGGFTLALEADSRRLAHRVEDYFRPFVTEAGGQASSVLEASLTAAQPAAGCEFVEWDGRGKESFADLESVRLVRKDRTGVLIRIDGSHWSIAGDLQRHFSQVANLIGAMYGVWLMGQGCSMVHASAVVRNGEAVAIIGQSGQGKSSVAVRLLEQGFDFLTNDRLLVQAHDDGIVAYGIPKLPRVNPGTLLAGERTKLLIDKTSRRRYERLSEEALWDLEEKRDLDVQESLGRRWLLTAPLGCAVVLGWYQAGTGLAVRRLEAAQAFEKLREATKTFGVFDRDLMSRSDSALKQLASTTPIYMASGAVDPTRLANEIADGRLRANR